jgi:hypothetical protein
MLSLVGKAYAQKITVSQPAEMRISDVGTLISGAIGAAFIIAGILVFGYLVWGGIQWITAGGDKANLEAARGRISSALVGMAIIAAAYAIVLLLQYVFGYTILGGVTLPTFY